MKTVTIKVPDLSGNRTYAHGAALIGYAIYSIAGYLGSVPPGNGLEDTINGLLQTEGVGILAGLFGGGLVFMRKGEKNTEQKLEQKIDALYAELKARENPTTTEGNQ